MSPLTVLWLTALPALLADSAVYEGPDYEAYLRLTDELVNISKSQPVVRCHDNRLRSYISGIAEHLDRNNPAFKEHIAKADDKARVWFEEGSGHCLAADLRFPNVSGSDCYFEVDGEGANVFEVPSEEVVTRLELFQEYINRTLAFVNPALTAGLVSIVGAAESGPHAEKCLGELEAVRRGISERARASLGEMSARVGRSATELREGEVGEASARFVRLVLNKMKAALFLNCDYLGKSGFGDTPRLVEEVNKCYKGEEYSFQLS